MIDFLAHRLAPFKHRHFKNFYFAQTLSQMGKWSSDLARSWIILEMIDKAWALGLVLLIAAIPNIILSLPAGVMVDRANVKKVLMIGYLVLAACALSLFLLIEFSAIQLWHILVLGFIEGVVFSFASPAYQVLTLRLVPPKDFQQTLIINTMNFHLGRMLGPAVAAIIMMVRGPSLVFLFDAITYIALIGILSKVVLFERKVGKKMPGLQSLKEGLTYIFKTPKIRYRMNQLFLSVVVFLPLSIVIYRTYLKLKFNLTGDEFGTLFSISAGGAFFGALAFVLISPHNPIKYLWFSVPGVVASILSVPWIPDKTLTAIMLFIGGGCAYVCFSVLTVSLHTHVEEEYRGRLASLIGLSFISLGPLAGYPIGAIADRIGYEKMIYFLGVMFAVLSAYNAYKYHLTKKRASLASPEHSL